MDDSDTPNAVQPRLRRADAERNREAILDAALACLGENTRASMAEIATAASIGRVTLYGHFSSRSDLIEAVFSRTMAQSEAALGELELDGSPLDVLQALVSASWNTVAESRLLLAAAEDELGEERVRKFHDEPLGRVRELVTRGQATGDFRTDLPHQWLVACFYAILHGAAEEVRAGRLEHPSAESIVSKSICSLFTPETSS